MRGALEAAGIVGPMGWLSRIRWTRAAQVAGIATGAIAALTAVVALGDAPPPRLADDIGVRMTAPVAVPPPRRPVAGRARPRAAGAVLARATARGLARERNRLRAAHRAHARLVRKEPAQPRSRPIGPAAAPAPAPSPAPAAAPTQAPAPAPVPAATVTPQPQPQPQPGPAGDGEFGFEN